MDQVLLKTAWEIREVYASDLSGIAAFYKLLKAKDKHEILPGSFGLPFLVALHEGKVAGFASLVPGVNGKIRYKCYNDPFIPYFSESEWQQELDLAFARQRRLFTDAGHLHSGISKLLRWISQS